jgi:hypothetical protein
MRSPAVAVGIGSRRSALLMSVLGGAWWALAASTADGAARLGLALLGLLVVAGLIVGSARRLRDSPAEGSAEPHPGDRRRVYGRVNAAQALAIPVIAVGAGASGHPALIAPLIAGVVGLHFLPLARTFRWRGYLAQGIGLLAVCGLGLALAAGGASAGTARLVTGAGAAAVLWGGVLAMLLTASCRRDAGS